VHKQGGDKHRAEQPEESGVRQDRREQGAQVFGVFVEGLRPPQDLEIAVHVHEDEEDEERTGNRHEELHEDGGAARRRLALKERRSGHGVHRIVCSRATGASLRTLL
jgi:hypothetical protein